MKANLSLVSAIIYTGLSLLAATLFLAITWAGEYGWVARIGGAVWVFLLSMIVLMPIVIPLIKKKYTLK